MPSRAAIELPARPRILVVSLRRIGDVLLTTPLIRSLRRAWPQASIDVLVFAGTADIIESNPDINRVIAMSPRSATSETFMLAIRLWRRYDLALSTQSGDRPTFFAFAAGRRRAGLTPAEGGVGAALKRFVLQRSMPALDNIHRVELMLRLADTIGIGRVPETVVPAFTGIAPGTSGGNYAVIHATPMFQYKQWTHDGWRALAYGLKQRGLPVVAIGGPGDAERKFLDGLWKDLATVRQLPWPQTAALLTRARVYIGADTAATHLAAASGCPTVALYGPTDPRVWGPWPVGGLAKPWAASGTIQNRGNVWLVQNPLPCLPCTFEGCERNVASPSICLDELKPEQVLAAVDQALA
jgi:heptosyltransferase-3